MKDATRTLRPRAGSPSLAARAALTALTVFALGASLSLLCPTPASAQTGPELLLRPFPKELTFEGRAEGLFQEGGHAKRTDDDFRLSVYETEGRVRLFPGELASPRVGYEFKYLDLDTNVPLLPDRLIDQSVGLATPIAKFDDWIVGLGLGLGYAGDSFFGDGDAYYGSATLVVFKQLSETDFLAFAVDYNGNRTFKPDVPLPGFGYVTRVQSNLLLTLGVPVTSIEWKPQENVRVEFAYLVVDNITARVTYEVAPGLEVYGSAAQRSDGFFLDEQRHNDDRLLFQQRRAEAGVAWRPARAGPGERDLELTAAVGYAWDGEFSIGFDQLDSDLVADVSDEPYFRVGLQVRF